MVKRRKCGSKLRTSEPWNLLALIKRRVFRDIDSRVQFKIMFESIFQQPGRKRLDIIKTCHEYFNWFCNQQFTQIDESHFLSSFYSLYFPFIHSFSLALLYLSLFLIFILHRFSFLSQPFLVSDHRTGSIWCCLDRTLVFITGDRAIA